MPGNGRTRQGGIDFFTTPSGSVTADDAFSTDPSVVMLASGNVGIGVTNPTTPLHVAGIAQIVESGNTAFYEGNGVRVFGTQNYRFRNTGGGVRAIIDVNSTGVTAGNLTLYNASNAVTTKLNNAGNSYLNGGNVGIGTASPAAKLDVSGDINIVSANISNQENADVDTGTETVANVLIASYTAAFFDFVIKSGTNVRAGTVYACHDGTNVEYVETSTVDLGRTSDVTLSVDISGTNMRLLATTTSDNWSVKSLVRAI